MILRSRSEKETLVFSKRIARTLKGGDVILLQGELGAGKTTFVRGLASAFKIKTRVKSPTFTLMHVHEVARSRQLTAHDKLQRAVGRKPSAIRRLVHVDAYRVKRAGDLKDIGLMDWLGRPDTLVVVEWGEKIKSLLRGKKYTAIKFRHSKNPTERVITLQP